MFLLQHAFLVRRDAALTDDGLGARAVALPHRREVRLALHAAERVEHVLDAFTAAAASRRRRLGFCQVLDHLLKAHHHAEVAGLHRTGVSYRIVPCGAKQWFACKAPRSGATTDSTVRGVNRVSCSRVRRPSNPGYPNASKVKRKKP